MDFRVIGTVREIETIASGRAIRDLRRLTKAYGAGSWRKRKGTARIELIDGAVFEAELHWYEGHGIGKKDLKIKRLIEEIS
jgi:hypothetical protein